VVHLKVKVTSNLTDVWQQLFEQHDIIVIGLCMDEMYNSIIIQTSMAYALFTFTPGCVDRNGLSSSVERWGRHAQQSADGVDEGC